MQNPFWPDTCSSIEGFHEAFSELYFVPIKWHTTSHFYSNFTAPSSRKSTNLRIYSGVYLKPFCFYFWDQFLDS